MTIEEDFMLVAASIEAQVEFVRRRSSGINGIFQLDDVKAALSRIEAELNYRFRAQDELRNGMFRFDELTKERDALKAQLDVADNMLIRLRVWAATGEDSDAVLPEEIGEIISANRRLLEAE